MVKLHELETGDTSQQETVCKSDTFDAANLPYKKRIALPKKQVASQGIIRANLRPNDFHASSGKRIALPKKQVLLQGIIKADLRPNDAHASSGKRIALPKKQVALQGIIRADQRPNDFHASSGVILPARTNQAKVGKEDEQRDSPTIKNNPQNCPAREVIWEGNFEIPDCPSDVGHCEGIRAHPSAKVSSKASTFAKQMAGKLQFVMHAQDQFLPDMFTNCRPNRDDIAIYFYPGHYERSRRQYSLSLKFIERNGLLLRSRMGDVELLVFPSKLFEVDSQKLNGSFFMWGVFHRIKGVASTSTAGAQTSPMETS